MDSTTSLNEIKENKGTDYLLKSFEQTSRRNMRYAIKLLNDNDLKFSTYFVLIPIIRKYNLINGLSLRNKAAMRINNDLSSKKRTNNSQAVSPDVLKWIVNSAITDDGINNKFDKICDYAIAKLINEHKDENTLNTAVELLFKRNQKDEYNHDLVWSIFKSNNTKALNLITEHLKSTDKKECNFCKELLKNATNGDVADENNAYNNYQNWITENEPYIQFTGNGFNMASSPNFCKIDTESKYLCKTKSSDESVAIQAMEMQSEKLNEFKMLDYQTQQKLSKMSKKLHDYDMNMWNKWKNETLAKQIELANAVMEV